MGCNSLEYTLFPEAKNCIAGTSQLERPRVLQVFTFKADFAVQQLIQGVIAHDAGFFDLPGDSIMCIQNIGVFRSLLFSHPVHAPIILALSKGKKDCVNEKGCFGQSH